MQKCKPGSGNRTELRVGQPRYQELRHATPPSACEAKRRASTSPRALLGTPGVPPPRQAPQAGLGPACSASSAAAWPPDRDGLRLLAEVRHALGQLENQPGIVGGRRARRFTLVEDPGIGPIGNARTTSTPGIVAHDIAPFAAVDVAMPVGDRCVVLVHETIMPGS